MTDQNGVAAVETMEDPVSQDALDAVDLSIPGDYETEIMALELVGSLAAYHKATMASRAARQAVDHQAAERAGKTVLLAKMQAALIQSRYPGAKAIADAIMREDVRRAQTVRAKG